MEQSLTVITALAGQRVLYHNVFNEGGLATLHPVLVIDGEGV